jgi:recombination endonuclease VII
MMVYTHIAERSINGARCSLTKFGAGSESNTLIEAGLSGKRLQLGQSETRERGDAVAEQKWSGVIRVPQANTLKKYGMTEDEFIFMLNEHGHACGVCKRPPKSGLLFIDHEHVRGWAKMEPEDRKKYVRGLACYVCNRFILNHRITTFLLKQAVSYLERYESRRAA